MDKEGHDANVTQQSFGALAYTTDPDSKESLATVHIGESSADLGVAQPLIVDIPDIPDFEGEDVEPAVIALPSDPDKGYILDLDETQMAVLRGWKLTKKTRIIKCKHFYLQTIGEIPMPVPTADQPNPASGAIPKSPAAAAKSSKQEVPTQM